MSLIEYNLPNQKEQCFRITYKSATLRARQDHSVTHTTYATLTLKQSNTLLLCFIQILVHGE